MSDSSRPHGLQPTRLLRPWDFPGKRTGVGCHRLLQPCRLVWDLPHCFCTFLRLGEHPHTSAEGKTFLIRFPLHSPVRCFFTQPCRGTRLTLCTVLHLCRMPQLLVCHQHQEHFYSLSFNASCSSTEISFK